MYVRGERNETWARRREPIAPQERRVLFVVLCTVAICVCTLLLARFRVYLPHDSEVSRYFVYATTVNSSGGIDMDRLEMDAAGYESLRRLVEESRFRYASFSSTRTNFKRVWTIIGMPRGTPPIQVDLVERSTETILYVRYGYGICAANYWTKVDPAATDFLLRLNRLPSFSLRP